MNSHPNLVSSANWQSRDLHSSPVIFLREFTDFSGTPSRVCAFIGMDGMGLISGIDYWN